MKKTIVLTLILASGYNTLLTMDLKKSSTGMELIRQLSPKRRRSQESNLIPQATIFKEIIKTETAPEMLLITARAKRDYNITPSQIANFALEQEKHEDVHKLIALQMIRITTYYETIAEKKKFCPVIHLHNNFSTIIEKYKKFSETRIWAKQSGISIAYSQQYQSAFNPMEPIPNIAFDEYIKLEADLYKLCIGIEYWNEAITMLLTTQQNTTTTTSQFIELDDNIAQ